MMYRYCSFQQYGATISLALSVNAPIIHVHPHRQKHFQHCTKHWKLQKVEKTTFLKFWIKIKVLRLRTETILSIFEARKRENVASISGSWKRDTGRRVSNLYLSSRYIYTSTIGQCLYHSYDQMSSANYSHARLSRVYIAVPLGLCSLQVTLVIDSAR